MYRVDLLLSRNQIQVLDMLWRCLRALRLTPPKHIGNRHQTLECFRSRMHIALLFTRPISSGHLPDLMLSLLHSLLLEFKVFQVLFDYSRAYRRRSLLIFLEDRWLSRQESLHGAASFEYAVLSLIWLASWLTVIRRSKWLNVRDRYAAVCHRTSPKLVIAFKLHFHPEHFTRDVANSQHLHRLTCVHLSPLMHHNVMLLRQANPILS